ncbi:TVP38/TMEM64 family protein [Paenibacillus daejeonensis]|uniref:TVP38/TMEM64 family protein n=1 Tax=Paenibacillus daejeonensis TaxID=135193 RepID=UPI00037373BB|nr:VTT domain-containing protein [Paenibacillus daejeonensis]
MMRDLNRTGWDNVQEWIETSIEQLIKLTGLHGYSLLLVTFPLALIQGIITIFPFATLLLLHVTSFGWFEGMMISWAAGTMASVACFYLSRTLLSNWIDRRFGERLLKYRKWQTRMNNYGVWVVILLRSLPFVPSNIVSIMAAVSPLKPLAYIWSTTVGMFSQVWLFMLLTAEVIFPEKEIRPMWMGYITFCGVLVLILIVVLLLDRQRGETGTEV